MTLSHNKICELEDFSHPELYEVIRQVFSYELIRFGADFPMGKEYRKYWEVAMAIRTLETFGVLHPEAEVLGVGAGNEPTIFYLTNYVRRVFATDLYLGTDWQESANLGMMLAPERYWSAAWNPRRLVVQHMNALDLQYEDHSFDAVFSSSSIEHFGSLEDVQRSLQEIARVLKPGGILSLSTEFRMAGNGPGLPGILMFDESQIHNLIASTANWVPLSPLDFQVSEPTWATACAFGQAIQELNNHLAHYGEILFPALTWGTYPHIVLREGEYVWTSIHLALQKQALQTAN